MARVNIFNVQKQTRKAAPHTLNSTRGHSIETNTTLKTHVMNSCYKEPICCVIQ